MGASLSWQAAYPAWLRFLTKHQVSLIKIVGIRSGLFHSTLLAISHREGVNPALHGPDLVSWIQLCWASPQRGLENIGSFLLAAFQVDWWDRLTHPGRKPRGCFIWEDIVTWKRLWIPCLPVFVCLLLRLKGPHHHYSDTPRPAKQNHHAKPYRFRSSTIRGAHLPDATL